MRSVLDYYTSDHKDPFDRMLITQATLENIKFVSNEKLFDKFALDRLW